MVGVWKETWKVIFEKKTSSTVESNHTIDRAAELLLNELDLVLYNISVIKLEKHFYWMRLKEEKIDLLLIVYIGKRIATAMTSFGNVTNPFNFLYGLPTYFLITKCSVHYTLQCWITLILSKYYVSCPWEISHYITYLLCSRKLLRLYYIN